jgi:hypothetical protein
MSSFNNNSSLASNNSSSNRSSNSSVPNVAAPPSSVAASFNARGTAHLNSTEAKRKKVSSFGCSFVLVVVKCFSVISLLLVLLRETDPDPPPARWSHKTNPAMAVFETNHKKKAREINEKIIFYLQSSQDESDSLDDSPNSINKTMSKKTIF